MFGPNLIRVSREINLTNRFGTVPSPRHHAIVFLATECVEISGWEGGTYINEVKLGDTFCDLHNQKLI
jgi:hypothetical protein